jgi:hypothetical protein
MSENQQKPPHKPTLCFTYEVKMVIQVLARDKDEADTKLDAEGGYISKREVTFRDMVDLYSGELETDETEKEAEKE